MLAAKDAYLVIPFLHTHSEAASHCPHVIKEEGELHVIVKPELS